MKILTNQNFFRLLNLSGFGLTAYIVYYAKKLSDMETKLEQIQSKNDQIKDLAIDSLSKKEELLNKNNELVEESKNVYNCMQNVSEKWAKIVELYTKNNNKTNNQSNDNSQINDNAPEILNELENTLNEIEKCNEQFESIVKFAIKSTNDDNSKKFIDSDKIIEYLQNINNLTFEQTVYVLHLTGAIGVLLSLISLITIFFSDFLINYFQLEQKYPRIAKFIQLRRKFQNYYFIVNSLIILVICVVTIYINLLLLNVV